MDDNEAAPPSRAPLASDEQHPDPSPNPNPTTAPTDHEPPPSSTSSTSLSPSPSPSSSAETEPASVGRASASRPEKPARLTLSSDELLQSLRAGNLPDGVDSGRADMPSRSALRRRTRRSMASTASVSAGAVSPAPYPWPQQQQQQEATCSRGAAAHEGLLGAELVEGGEGEEEEEEGRKRGVLSGGGEVSASESDAESHGERGESEAEGEAEERAEGIERWMREHQAPGAAEGGGKAADEGYGSEDLDEAAARKAEEEKVK